GIQGSMSYFDPDVLVSWSGEMWELNPVEVRARPRPARRMTLLEEPEAKIFRDENVDPAAFRANLQSRNLAVIVSRNVTSRDAADKQQPYNLRVTGTTTQKVVGSSKRFDIASLQLFQPGEVRVCAACHGVNSHDQLGAPAPTNSPEALRSLLRAWKASQTTTPRHRAAGK